MKKKLWIPLLVAAVLFFMPAVVWIPGTVQTARAETVEEPSLSAKKKTLCDLYV